MRHVIASVAIALAAVTLHTSANAASLTTLAAGVLVDPNASADGLGGGLADFNTPTSVTTYGQSGPTQGPFSVGTASFSGSGILMTNAGQDALGLYAEPFHDTTQYLTVQPAGPTETVKFSQTYSTLGLYWGSMDTYNSIQFYLAGNLVDTVTGTAAAAAVPPSETANGAQTDDSNNRYVIINNILGGSFDSIVLVSTGNSFELDNLAWGSAGSQGAPGQTPLPAALPLFGSVLGGGLMIRRLRKRAKR